jgi:hypothetical protein
MAASFWQRHFRKILPATLAGIVVGVLTVFLAAGVREARRAAQAATTT